MKLRAHCTSCSVPVVRSPRQGIFERVGLAPLPFVRPFRCPVCRTRTIRFTRRPSRNGLFLFLLTILVGILLIQILWYYGLSAGDYTSNEYDPKDVERQRYEESQKAREGR
jgi:hypothetical protein